MPHIPSNTFKCYRERHISTKKCDFWLIRRKGSLITRACLFAREGQFVFEDVDGLVNVITELLEILAEVLERPELFNQVAGRRSSVRPTPSSEIVSSQSEHTFTTTISPKLPPASHVVHLLFPPETTFQLSTFVVWIGFFSLDVNKFEVCDGNTQPRSDVLYTLSTHDQ